MEDLAVVNINIVMYEQEVTVNPQQLFNRTVCLADLPSLPMYELAPRPPHPSIRSLCIVQQRQLFRHCWNQCSGPAIRSCWWPPAAVRCLAQACHSRWSMPDLCMIHNSALQTGFQHYIWWVWPTSLQQIIRTGQEGRKENVCQYLDGWKYSHHNRFPE